MIRAPKTAKRRKKHPSKWMKKKTARPSTTRSTAGPGFDFEDQVAAWLLLKALTGQPLPGIEGSATRLQMQVEALGWDIDDILLTAAVSPDDQRHLAISCKSNVQVTASGLPADFVTRCWRQWAKPDAARQRLPGAGDAWPEQRIYGDLERAEGRGTRRGPRPCGRPHARDSQASRDV
jgi:hypothetical protein